MLNNLVNLHKLCFPDKPWSAKEFASLQKSGAEIVGSDNGFIVWRIAADECEIITIGVHPEYRGTGIASAMLQLMEREILKKNHMNQIKIFLEVSVDNLTARALYEKHGYKQIGIRPGYYMSPRSLAKVDAVVMEKIINPTL
ncbi:MAG: ribosomal protein S18-alanine N-acetyltransferase [Alphaproteobacteria bacterium]|nr:ribosomal protein S18-alanine N-acetyltransferase [Alphaproteobacteria bacterium]